MIVHQGIYLPDGEKHLPEWMDKAGEIVDGKGSYQIKKYRKAVSYCTNFRTAVDIGAHVGFWSMQMAKQFAQVASFEPIPQQRECFMRNLEGCENVELFATALGERAGFVRIITQPTSSGDSLVDAFGNDGVTAQPTEGEGKCVPVKTLDSFELENVDFIKADCEGYELFALRGGIETIKRCRPVVIVEQKPKRGQKFGLTETGAVQFLESLGYRMMENLSGDFIVIPT